MPTPNALTAEAGRSRRQFLQALSASMGTACVAACGGATSADPIEPTSPAVPVPASPTPPAPPPWIAPPLIHSRQFSLSSPNAGLASFALGFAFRQGDIAATEAVVASIPNVQVIVKNRWPDGSVKFAAVAGRTTLPSLTPVEVSLKPGAGLPAGVSLTTADLRRTGIVASTACGTFGSATWEGPDWDATVQTWIAGPEMSSWIYRKAIGDDPHLVAWLEVRLFAGGAVEVLPWIENGFLTVPGPTSKQAEFSFFLGATRRFVGTIDLLNHQRTPLIGGSALSHWLGIDPSVTVRHHAGYLQSTELVPSYSAQTPNAAEAVINLPTTFTPLQKGNLPSVMGAAGYDPSIGLLPEWDVLYLTSSASSVWAGLQRNAYSAGRYGIHFRDETTHRPLRFAVYPNLCMGEGSAVVSNGSSTTGAYTPQATGDRPPAYASSHAPALGYMAALLTGWHYHIETIQFQATANYLKNGNLNRNFSDGIFVSSAGANLVRGAAWAIRTLAMAACLTPDEDRLQGEFIASLRANIDRYHARYVARPNNPFGWITPYSDYTADAGDNQWFDASWMQDFFTATCGYVICLGLPIPADSARRLLEFFAWKAKSVVGRFGGSDSKDYLYRDAAMYTMSIAPSDQPDFNGGTGPWHDNWGEIWMTAAHQTGLGASSRVEGDLRGGNYPDATSYWGNLQPALAYAVRHNVQGAQAARRRMTTAANWPQMTASFNSNPVWSIIPG